MSVSCGFLNLHRIYTLLNISMIDEICQRLCKTTLAFDSTPIILYDRCRFHVAFKSETYKHDCHIMEISPYKKLICTLHMVKQEKI